MFTLSAFQDRPSYLYIAYLCLLELLVVKNYVKLEKKKQHLEKIKASGLFLAKKHVIFLQFVNIYIISPTKQNFVMNL